MIKLYDVVRIKDTGITGIVVNISSMNGKILQYIFTLYPLLREEISINSLFRVNSSLHKNLL